MPGPVADHLAVEPLRAVDVGAARGICPHWQPFLEHLRVEAFEPNAAECARLAARSHPHIRWHPVALASQRGPRELHVLATPTGSSFFPLDPGFVTRFGVPDYHREVEVLTLDCVSLGDHFADLGPGGPHLLKLDTQGSELEILSGLRPEQYDDVLSVELESEISPPTSASPSSRRSMPSSRDGASHCSTSGCSGCTSRRASNGVTTCDGTCAWRPARPTSLPRPTRWTPSTCGH